MKKTRLFLIALIVLASTIALSLAAQPGPAAVLEVAGRLVWSG